MYHMTSSAPKDELTVVSLTVELLSCQDVYWCAD